MSPLLRRLLRDAALVPLAAFVVHALVAHLPAPREADAKVRVSAAVMRDQRERLCTDRWDGFLCPWQDLAAGRPLADESGLYDVPQLARALAGSLRLGALALLVALVGATAYALVSTGPVPAALRAALDGWPALVFATPTFLVALAAARFTGASLDDDKAAFEPVAAPRRAFGTCSCWEPKKTGTRR